MPSLTAHCLIKNEENFVEYAIRSVIDFVDKIIVFDTGSADKTVEIVNGLVKEYPEKIIFEEKGGCDKARHTQLRQEMLDRTTTDWFMILDGDEVWTRRGMEEVREKMGSPGDAECFIAPFYLCVGDIFNYSWRGKYELKGKKIHATARFFKSISWLQWTGKYGVDSIRDKNGEIVAEEPATIFLKNKFWHLTHLERSAVGERVYSSGGERKSKIVLTYLLVGKKIGENIPEVFMGKVTALTFGRALINFFEYFLSKIFI